MKGKMKKMGSDMAGEKEELKHGGKAKGKKHGGKIGGKKTKERADKYARGGAAKGMSKKVTSAAGMSPTSPLSGAGKTGEPKGPKLDKEDD